jgi:hypothetical protein
MGDNVYITGMSGCHNIKGVSFNNGSSSPRQNYSTSPQKTTNDFTTGIYKNKKVSPSNLPPRGTVITGMVDCSDIHDVNF